MKNSLFVQQTQSTNTLLWEMLRKEGFPEGFVVHTDFQTAGKGQSGNSWESERGENLLFSILLHPLNLPLDQLFFISQLVSVAIKKVLDEITDEITVKWPNDIYWNDKKLGGILIENSLQAKSVKTVVGIGLNINQKKFFSDAPNPVSLREITGKCFDRNILLEKIVENILELNSEHDLIAVRAKYAQNLYRKEGFHSYSANGELLQAKINTVQHDGQLILETANGKQLGFYFKEVKFV